MLPHSTGRIPTIEKLLRIVHPHPSAAETEGWAAYKGEKSNAGPPAIYLVGALGGFLEVAGGG